MPRLVCIWHLDGRFSGKAVVITEHAVENIRVLARVAPAAMSTLRIKLQYSLALDVEGDYALWVESGFPFLDPFRTPGNGGNYGYCSAVALVVRDGVVKTAMATRVDQCDGGLLATQSPEAHFRVEEVL